MKTWQFIPLDYRERMEQVLSLSWKIFISHFINQKYKINSEAPFQFHFAQIIKSVGDLYCISENDLFKLDLETKVVGIKGKTKYFDITCEFYNKIKCAAELKFKLKRQGAQDWGRIDAYRDIENLEIAVLDKGIFDMGKFYMITDYSAYIKKSTHGSGTIFSLHDGHIIKANNLYHTKRIKGREDVFVKLKKSYEIKWFNLKNWYFLELTV